MEKVKTEVEKKVSRLLNIIQNKKKIPNATKKELVGIVKDLHEQCHLLYSVFDDLRTDGRKGKLGNASISRSSLDLDYYSSEDIEINASNVTESLSLDNAVMLKKLQETELSNEDLKRQVSNLKQETDYLRDQNMELAGDIGGKRNEEIQHFKGLMTKGEAALLCNQKEKLESELGKKNKQVLEMQMRLKRMEEETDELKSKVNEIDRLKEENQKMHIRNVQIDETEDKSKNLETQVKEQEDIIYRLSMEIQDQKKLLKEQKDAIDKFSEDQKQMKRLSFG